jgi:hypothetical protein
MIKTLFRCGLGARSGVAKTGRKWGKVGDAETDELAIRCAPDENPFTLVGEQMGWVYHRRRF